MNLLLELGTLSDDLKLAGVVLACAAAIIVISGLATFAAVCESWLGRSRVSTSSRDAGGKGDVHSVPCTSMERPKQGAPRGLQDDDTTLEAALTDDEWVGVLHLLRADFSKPEIRQLIRLRHAHRGSVIIPAPPVSPLPPLRRG